MAVPRQLPSPVEGDIWGVALNDAIKSLHLGPDVHTALPAVADCPTGSLFMCTTHSVVHRNTGTEWIDYFVLSVSIPGQNLLMRYRGDWSASPTDGAYNFANVVASGGIIYLSTTDANTTTPGSSSTWKVFGGGSGGGSGGDPAASVMYYDTSANAYPSRPSTDGDPVIWDGPVQPTGWLDGDTWIDTSAGDASPGGYLVYKNSAYPGRADLQPVTFVGPVSPNDLGLMVDGDTWINTNASSFTDPPYVPLTEADARTAAIVGTNGSALRTAIQSMITTGINGIVIPDFKNPKWTQIYGGTNGDDMTSNASNNWVSQSGTWTFSGTGVVESSGAADAWLRNTVAFTGYTLRAISAQVSFSSSATGTGFGFYTTNGWGGGGLGIGARADNDTLWFDRYGSGGGTGAVGTDLTPGTFYNLLAVEETPTSTFRFYLNGVQIWSISTSGVSTGAIGLYQRGGAAGSTWKNVKIYGGNPVFSAPGL